MVNCDEYKLSLYIDGMLSTEDTRAIEKHLDECGACRGQYTELLGIIESLKDFDEIPLPSGFHRQAIDMVRENPNVQLDFVNKRIPIRPIKWDRKAFVRRYGTVAAGLLLTLMLFGGISGVIQSSQPMAKSAAQAVSGGASQDTGTGAHVQLYGGANAAASAPTPQSEGASEPAPQPERAPMSTPMPQGAATRSDMFAFSEAAAVMDDAELENANAMEQSALRTPAMDDSDIKNYSIRLEVDDFDAALAELESLPGHSVSSNILNHSETAKNADMVRAVSVAEYESVKQRLKALGRVDNEWESVQRVYMDVADNEARIRAKETEIARLYELLEKSASVNAMISIERRLEATSYELDSLKSSYLNYMRNLSSPTVNVSLFYRDTTPQYKDVQSFSERVSARFVSSLNTTFVFIENAVVFVSSVSFPLIIICVVVFAAFAVRDTLKRRGGHEKE